MLTSSKLKKMSLLISMLLILLVGLTACGGSSTKSASNQPDHRTLKELVAPAQKEGKVVSVGMPDSWANWKDTWKDLKTKYNIEHTDTDMSSAEEIAKFLAEKNKPTADIGDVGVAFGPFAVQKGVTLPFKTQYWDELPAWAKDKDGNWSVGYQGTMAFLCNTTLVKDCPTSWADLAKGTYKVSVGDVQKAAQAQFGVLAAAIANGGSESNIQPGIDYFTKLAKAGRLSKVDVKVPNIEKGEVPVAIVWDFNALGYKYKIGADKFVAHIPTDGSAVSGYAELINKYAPHPDAAKLARTYIMSDAGQINLAKGFARPIRNVKLPADIAAKMIPSDEYKNAKPVNDYNVWAKTVKELPQLWQEKVQVYIK